MFSKQNSEWVERDVRSERTTRGRVLSIMGWLHWVRKVCKHPVAQKMSGLGRASKTTFVSMDCG